MNMAGVSVPEWTVGIYKKMEDAFYSALDWLDEHNVPVYRVHDWLEDHGIPPFPAFLAVVFLLIGGVLLWALPGAGSSSYTVFVQVVDQDGNPVPGAAVVLKGPEGLSLTPAPVMTDQNGTAVFYNVPPGPYSVTITKNGFKPVDNYPISGTSAVVALHYEGAGTKEVCVRPVDSQDGQVPDGVTVLGKYVSASTGVQGTALFQYDAVDNVFCAQVPKDAELNVVVTGGDYNTISKTVTGSYPPNAPLTITLYPSETPMNVEGKGYPVTVSVTANGQPYKALVIIRHDNGTKLAQLQTQPVGTDQMVTFTNVPAGRYVIKAIGLGGEYNSYVATKTVNVTGPTEVNIDLAVGKYVPNPEATESGQVVEITGEANAPTKNAPKSVTVKICPLNGMDNSSVNGGYVLLDDQNAPVKNGCAIFKDVNTGEHSVSVHVPGFGSFSDTIAVMNNFSYYPRIYPEDAPPSIGRIAYYSNGLPVVAPVAGKTVEMRIYVYVPRNVKDEKIEVSARGIAGVSVGGGATFTKNLGGGRGAMVPVNVPITVAPGIQNAAVNVTLRYTVASPEGAKEENIERQIAIPIAPVLLVCGNGKTAMSIVVPGASEGNVLLTGQQYTVNVYYGSCDENGTYSVKLTADGNEIALIPVGSGPVNVAAGTIDMKDFPADRPLMLVGTLIDESGKLVQQYVKYYNVGKLVASWSVNVSPSGEANAELLGIEGETGTVPAVFKGYTTKITVQANGKYADYIEANITYTGKQGNQKTDSGVVNGSWSDQIVPYGDTVTVGITFYTTTATGKRIPVKSVVKEYPVIEHTNKVTLCIRDYDTGKAVANADIELVSAVQSYTGTTGKDGCYTFTGVLDGDYNAIITADNHLPANRSLGEIKSDVKKTLLIFAPVSEPKIVPAELKVGGDSVAAVPEGSSATLKLTLVLPPRTTGGHVTVTITNPAGGYIFKGDPISIKPMEKSGEQTVSVSFDVPADTLQGTDIDYAQVSAEANVSVQTEGGTTYKTGSSNFQLAVVPANVQLKCAGTGAAFVAFKYNGRLVNSVPPPAEGEKRSVGVVLYYGSCQPNTPANGGTVVVSTPSKTITQKIQLYGGEPFQAQALEGAATLEIDSTMRGKSVSVGATVNFEDGSSTKAANTLKVGEPLYLVLIPKGELIADGKKHEIDVKVYNPDTGQISPLTDKEIDEVNVCITGTTAELVKNPPLCMNKEGKIFVGATQAGAITFACSSDYYACTVRPEVLWIAPSSAETGLTVSCPSPMFVAPGGSNKYRCTVTNGSGSAVYLMSERGEYMASATITSGKGVQISIIPEESSTTLENGREGYVTVQISAAKDASSTAEADVRIYGYWTSKSNGYIQKNWVMGEDTPEITVSTKQQVSLKVTPDLSGTAGGYISGKACISVPDGDIVKIVQNPDQQLQLDGTVKYENSKDGIHTVGSWTEKDSQYCIGVISDSPAPKDAKSAEADITATAQIGSIKITGNAKKSVTLGSGAVKVVANPDTLNLVDRESDKTTFTVTNNFDSSVYLELELQSDGAEISSVTIKKSSGCIVISPFSNGYAQVIIDKEGSCKVDVAVRDPAGKDGSVMLAATTAGITLGKATVSIIGNANTCLHGFVTSDTTETKFYLRNDCDQPITITDVRCVSPEGNPIGSNEKEIKGGGSAIPLCSYAKGTAATKYTVKVSTLARTGITITAELKGTYALLGISPIPEGESVFGSADCSTTVCGYGEFKHWLEQKIAEMSGDTEELKAMVKAGTFSLSDLLSDESGYMVNVVNGSCTDNKGVVRTSGYINICLDSVGASPNIELQSPTTLRITIKKVDLEDGGSYYTVNIAKADTIQLLKYPQFLANTYHINLPTISIDNGTANMDSYDAPAAVIFDNHQNYVPLSTELASGKTYVALADGKYIEVVDRKPSGQTIEVTTTDCEGIDAIAEISGDTDNKNKITIAFCKQNESTDDITKTLQEILSAMFNPTGSTNLLIVESDKKYYITGLFQGGSSQLPVYVAPGATTYIKPDALGLDQVIASGTMDVQIVTNDSSCKIGFSIAGETFEESGRKNYDLTKLKNNDLSITVPSGCKTPLLGTITVTITPVVGNQQLAQDIRKITLQINPLSVSFDKLVAALTCPQFRLDALQEDVVRTVLAAAVGKDNPCSAIQNATGIQGEVAGKEYTWNVERSSVLTYVAKNGDKEAFRIVFDRAEPVVWVKDIPEKEKACDEVKDRIFTSELEKKYTNYDLHLIINGDDCLPKYGMAEKTELSRALEGPKLFSAGGIWAATCVGTYLACAYLTGGIGGGMGDAGKGMLSCFVGPALSMGLTYLTKDRLIEPEYAATGAGLFGLATGVYGYRSYQYWQSVRFAAKSGKSVAQEFADVVRWFEEASPHRWDALELASGSEGLQTAGELVGSCVGGSSQACKEGAVVQYSKNLRDRLRDLAKVARAAGDDELADQLDDAVKVLDDAIETGKADKIMNALNKVDNLLKNSAQQIKNLPKALKDKINKLKKSSLCAPLANAVGAVSGALYVMGQVAHPYTLDVKIYSHPIVVISTGKEFVLDNHTPARNTYVEAK